MRAVRFRVGRLLREQWRATVALSLAVAVVCGAVLALAAGTERTLSAPDRFTAARGGAPDAEVQQDGGRPRTAEVARLAAVRSVDATSFVFGGLARPGGGAVPDTLIFAGSPQAFSLRLVAGRQPDPAKVGEFIATRSFLETHGGAVAIGDRFDLVTLTQEQADRAGFDTFAEGPRGPDLEAVLVGVVDGPSELDDPTPLAMFSESLIQGSEVGVSATIMSVRLQPGTDLGTLRTQLDTLADGGGLSVTAGELVSTEVRAAVRGQGQGLGVLAAVAAVAAVAVIGQLVTRRVRLTVDERRRLCSIGMSQTQVFFESLARAAVPVMVGALVGVVVAVSLSGLFPTGFVRRIEPSPGLRVDVSVLALCTVGLLAALMLWNALALVPRPGPGLVRPSALVESIVARIGRATCSVGVRFAFTRSRRDRGSVRAAVTGMLLTTTLVVAAVVFGSSLGLLVHDGSRFGNNFQLQFGSGGDSVPGEIVDALDADGDVEALMLYGVGQARSGSVTLRLAGMDPVRGDIAPIVLKGRLPTGPDEIALGRLSARALNSEVGSDLTLESDGRLHPFRVTGLAVVPGVGGLDGVGQDGIITMDGLARLDSSIVPSVAVADLRAGASAEAADRLGAMGLEGGNSRPVVILNLERIRATSYHLALVLGALAVLTFAQMTLSSVRNRRRDVAVLRSMGADNRWIARLRHWQVTTLVLLPVALGLPLGLIVGRLVFGAFADTVGTVNDASFPYLMLLAMVVGLVLVANAVSVVPARRTRSPV